MYSLLKTEEFRDWYNEQPVKSRVQIDDRLLRIATEEHFGACKPLTDAVWELKWASGRRVYFAYLAERNILLLLGGNKNGQTKDIRQAEKILRYYAEISS